MGHSQPPPPQIHMEAADSKIVTQTRVLPARTAQVRKGKAGDEAGRLLGAWAEELAFSQERPPTTRNLCGYPAPFNSTSLLLSLTQGRAEELNSSSAKRGPQCPRPTLHPSGVGCPRKPPFHSYCSSAGYLRLWVEGMHPLLRHCLGSGLGIGDHCFKVRVARASSEPASGFPARKCGHPCLPASQAGSLPAR